MPTTQVQTQAQTLPETITVMVSDLNKNVSPKDFAFVDPRKIVIIDNFNVRKDYGDIEELANSITENGVKVAIRVKKHKIAKNTVLMDGSVIVESTDGYALIDGHRRCRALKFLFQNGKGIDRVPVEIVQESKTEEQRTIEMYVANTGKPFTPMENAELFGRLNRVHKKTPQEIAKKLGVKSLSLIYNGIEMSMAPDYIKNLIHSNIISYSIALDKYNNVFNKNWDETEEFFRSKLETAQETVAESLPELNSQIEEDTRKASEQTEKVEMPSGNDSPVIVSPTGMTLNLNDVKIEDDGKDSSEKRPEGSGRHNNQKVNKAPKPVVSKEVKEKASKIAPDAVRKEVKKILGGNTKQLKGSQPVISPETAKVSKSRVDFLIQKIKDSNLPTDNKMFMMLEALAQKEGEYRITDAYDIYNQFIGG